MTTLIDSIRALLNEMSLQVHTMYCRTDPLSVMEKFSVDPRFFGPTAPDTPADHPSELVPLACETGKGTARVPLSTHCKCTYKMKIPFLKSENVYLTSIHSASICPCAHHKLVHFPSEKLSTCLRLKNSYIDLLKSGDTRAVYEVIPHLK